MDAASSRLSPDPRFRGVFTAITTPFTPDASRIDFARMEFHIAAQAAAGVAGVVICGTTGESPTIEEREFHELVERGVGFARSKRLMAVVGTGSNSTAHAVAMQRLAAKAGADAALSVNPYYNKPTQAGMVAHFTAVADAADLPVILYNIPGRTGVALTLETIERLSRHPNIRAIKDATGGVELAGETAARCPGLTVLSGDDPLTLPMISVGAAGVVSVVSNVAPSRVVALCRAALDGRFGEALFEHRRLLPLARALFAESNPIPLKAALRLMGRDSGAVRLPLTPASEATLAGLRAALTEAELM